MKLWHDDLRPAPDGWEWARTNDNAREMLQTGEVTIISLDHDMGLHTIQPDTVSDLRGADLDNGMMLVKWMVEKDLVPPEVVIHSWNVDGARRMYMYLNEHGFDCVYEAYSP